MRRTPNLQSFIKTVPNQFFVQIQADSLAFILGGNAGNAFRFPIPIIVAQANSTNTSVLYQMYCDYVALFFDACAETKLTHLALN